MLSVIILSVIMLSAIMLSAIMLSAIMLSVIILGVIMLSVIVVSVIMLIVIMLSVIMLGVAAPDWKLTVVSFGRLLSDALAGVDVAVVARFWISAAAAKIAAALPAAAAASTLVKVKSVLNFSNLYLFFKEKNALAYHGSISNTF
jgi:hypothetical protein